MLKRELVVQFKEGVVTAVGTGLLGADLRTDDAEALRFVEAGQPDRAWSWAQLGTRADRFAAALRAAGISRLAFLDRNYPACLEAAYGGSRAGAVTSSSTGGSRPRRSRTPSSDSQAQLVLVGPELGAGRQGLRGAAAAGAQVVVLGEEYEAWLAAHEPGPAVQADPGTAVLQLYTSGTTGFPKGVMITHRMIGSHNAAAREVVPIGPDAVALVPMPLYHVGGLAYALSTLASGARTVVLRDPVPGVLLDTLEREGVTHTFVVPALLAALLQERERDLSSLQVLLYGASPMPAPLMRASLARFPGKLGQVYGMTELSGAVTYLGPEDHADTAHPERLLSAGRPYPGVELRVVDAAGQDVPTGELGELWVRSAQCTPGYWGKPEATADTLVEGGWLRTGDIARLDDGGYLFLEDRLKDMVISGGENVYPAEVERVLLLDPSVAEVAVIGVPDERWGETVKAVVVPAEGATVDPAALIALCRQHLAGYKRPTSVDVVDALPRNATGKVLRRELREPYWQGDQRRV